MHQTALHCPFLNALHRTTWFLPQVTSSKPVLSDAASLHSAIRVCHVAQPTPTSVAAVIAQLFPSFQSGLGAALVLFSALLSRGLVRKKYLMVFSGCVVMRVTH